MWATRKECSREHSGDGGRNLHAGYIRKQKQGALSKEGLEPKSLVNLQRSSHDERELQVAAKLFGRKVHSTLSCEG
eukprot:4279598-Amphidinium_carterae.1